jgi:uncharacterized Zn finger protein
MQNCCNHDRTELIARRGGVDYVRCKQCGAVFEADDLEPAPVSRRRSEEEEEGWAYGKV